MARHNPAEYLDYLASPEWRAKRMLALKRAGFCCQLCNYGGAPLDVHHRTYARLGDERVEDLTVLCRKCHDAFHALRFRAGRSAPDHVSWFDDDVLSLSRVRRKKKAKRKKKANRKMCLPEMDQAEEIIRKARLSQKRREQSTGASQPSARKKRTAEMERVRASRLERELVEVGAFVRRRREAS